MLLKTRAILVVVVGTVMGLSLSLSGGLIASHYDPEEEELALEQARLLAEVMQRVKHDYVEPIDDSELFESAIRGMVSDLDAHSQYLDAGEYRDIRISTTGSYTGLGIEVDEVGGNVMVVTPIAGSPPSTHCDFQPRSSAAATFSCLSSKNRMLSGETPAARSATSSRDRLRLLPAR